MGNLLLGIDVGTYSSKGVLVEPDGNVLRSYVTEHGMEVPHPGWAEQDADKIWWTDVVKICQVLLNGNPYTGADVGGIAVSAIGPCVLPLDAKGNPLRPGILYGVDTRASAEIQYLNHVLNEEIIYDFSGMKFSSQAAGPKILWIKNNEPEIWKKTAHVTTASSYLVFRLTGEKVIDRHTASHYMPLMDINRLDWSERFANEIIDPDKLPDLAWSDELAGYVNKKAAEQTGLNEGTPVAVGAVDALSEAISVGAVNPGDLMIMYGSTAFFILVLNQPVPDPRMWTVAGAFDGQYNLAAGMATTGSLTRWFRDELARDLSTSEAYEILFRDAESIEPGAGGLLILPYFSGERTPINDPDARGIIAGLSLAHTRNHIFRAILEGIGFGIRHNIDTFNDIGAGVQRVVAVGGGTKSEKWMEIVSSIAGITQIIPELTIGASYGDAFLAGMATGKLSLSNLKEWVKIKTEIAPNKTTKNFYHSLYDDYLALYKQNRNLLHHLVSRNPYNTKP
jgi:xylulokinase